MRKIIMCLLLIGCGPSYAPITNCSLGINDKSYDSNTGCVIGNGRIGYADKATSILINFNSTKQLTPNTTAYIKAENVFVSNDLAVCKSSWNGTTILNTYDNGWKLALDIVCADVGGNKQLLPVIEYGEVE